MTDDGFVVSEAVRLDEAAVELRNIFEACGILPPDRKHKALAFYTGLAAGMPFYGPSDYEAAVAREDWVASCFLAAICQEKLKNDLSCGQLSVWIADQTGERSRDHRVLFAPNACAWHQTLTTGYYIPAQGQPATPPSYVHSRLWVKNADWTVFRLRAAHLRGGAEVQHLFQAVQPLGNNTIKLTSATVEPPVGKGRPKGTGFDQLDAPFVDQMFKLIRSGKASSATAAARQVANQAAGASFESTVRRLQRAYTAKERKGE